MSNENETNNKNKTTSTATKNTGTQTGRKLGTSKAAINGQMDANNHGDVSTSADYNSDFIDLDDLVYAPLHALAQSNEQLKCHVLNAIRQMGTLQKKDKEDIIKLSNLNVAYDQLRPNGEDGYSMDSMQLQVPTLSIVPITNLNVDKAEIEFAAEVNVANDKDNGYKVTGRISAPEQRDSDFLPKVKYKMSISSMPATEGIMRLTDMLSSNFVAKQIASVPVNTDGEVEQEDAAGIVRDLRKRKEAVRKLQALYADVTRALEKHDKWANLANSDKGGAEDAQRKRYVELQQRITTRLQELQCYITKREADKILQDVRSFK